MRLNSALLHTTVNYSKECLMHACLVLVVLTHYCVSVPCKGENSNDSFFRDSSIYDQ